MHSKITQSPGLGLVVLPNFQALRDHELKSNLAIEHILGGTKEGKVEQKNKEAQKPLETENVDAYSLPIPTGKQAKN
jgi:hypothetical protein